jgi:hypothetical protein
MGRKSAIPCNICQGKYCSSNGMLRRSEQESGATMRSLQNTEGQQGLGT